MARPTGKEQNIAGQGSTGQMLSRAQLGKIVGEEELGERPRKIGWPPLGRDINFPGPLAHGNLPAVHRFPREVPQGWAVVRGLSSTSNYYLNSPRALGSTTGKSKAILSGVSAW